MRLKYDPNQLGHENIMGQDLLRRKIRDFGSTGAGFDFLRKNMDRSNDLAVQPSVFRFWRGIFVQSLTV